MLQHPLHRKLQEVVVPQVKPGQVDPGEHTRGEAPQKVGVEEQQLERRHGVEGVRIHLVDLIVLEIQVPAESRWRYGKKGNTVPRRLCFIIKLTELKSPQSVPSMKVTQYTSNIPVTCFG